MIVVLIRGIRPYLPVLGPVIWLAWRVTSSETTSLLDYLHIAMLRAEDSSMAMASQSAWSAGYVPLTRWFWIVVKDWLAITILSTILGAWYSLYHTSFEEWKDWWTDTAFHWVLHHVPTVEDRFDKLGRDVFLSDGDALAKLLGRESNRTKQLTIPAEGLGPTKVIEELAPYSEAENSKIELGKLSGTVYHYDPEHTDLMNKAYALYTWANPLHTGYWPKLNQCSCEVLAMTGNMLHAAPQDNEPLGVMTSGGTESIFCAIKASLEYYGKRRGIKSPELICGTSAHAAVDKACQVLGIRQIRVDCSKGVFKLSPKAVRSRITSNTILIYASAPTYPQGVVDPIEDLSSVALQYGIGLHVDACLGGFVLAFWKDAPKFDFQAPGVTSMSIDTHKYGYAAKGSSCVFYRDKKLRNAQYFCYAKWSGGIYCTPTLAGSKAGALEVCAWAALMSIGRNGYEERVEIITVASKRIAGGIVSIPEMVLMTDKPSMVVCFTSRDENIDIYSVCSKMGKKGWTLNELQNPASIHVCVTVNVARNADLFVEELKEVIGELRKEQATKKGTVGIYGMTGPIPAGPVNTILNEFLDLTLAP
ncbi:MAG: hypothetical protein SGILL_006770 [Bacillariaceae sp.]